MNFQLLMSTKTQYTSYKITLIAYRALIRDHLNFLIKKTFSRKFDLRDE